MKKTGLLVVLIFLAGCIYHHKQIPPSAETQCFALKHQYAMQSGVQKESSEQGITKQSSQKQQELRTEYSKLQCPKEIKQTL